MSSEAVARTVATFYLSTAGTGSHDGWDGPSHGTGWLLHFASSGLERLWCSPSRSPRINSADRDTVTLQVWIWLGNLFGELLPLAFARCMPSEPAADIAGKTLDSETSGASGTADTSQRIFEVKD